jgi:uncharacterized cupin superfamily protein
VSWYIKNIRDVQWWDAGRFGIYGDFEQGEHFPEFGFNFGVAWPGQPAAMYHREEHQEGFLVLSGEILLIVEGEERLLKAWDYFHCPAGVEHITVGAGTGPAFLIAVGGRVGPGNPVYPVNDVALEHGAGVERETSDPKEAYGPFPEPQKIPFREEFLPPFTDS